MPLAAYRAPQTTTDWIVLGCILAVVAAVSVFQVFRHRRRRTALAGAARELGLESVDAKSPDAAYIHRPVKGEKSHKVTLCAVGIVADRSARLAEFTYVTGSGKSSRTHHNLQLSLECPEFWPTIHLCDRPGIMNRPISELFRSAKPATDDAAFDKRWQVEGPEDARRMLTPELRAVLLKGEKAEFWSIQDGWLTCTWRRACKPADLPVLLARTQQVRDATAAILDA